MLMRPLAAHKFLRLRNARLLNEAGGGTCKRDGEEGGKQALGSFGKQTKMKVGREVREIHIPPFNNLRHFTFLSLVPHKI